MLGRKLFSSGLVLGLVVSVSFPAHAELLKNFKTDGSIEVRSFGINNEADRNSSTDDYRSEANTRLMVGGSFDLLDDVHARVLLRKNNRNYGNGNGGGAPGASENLDTVQSSVFVDNAYTKIDKVMGHVDLTFGRQFYGDPNDLVLYFGPQNDDVLTVTALDAFRADADIMGWAKFEGVFGKVSDTGATAAVGVSNADTDLFGGKLSTDKLIPKGGVGLSYWTLKTKNAASTLGNNTLNEFDICALGDIPFIGGLSYHGDYIQEGGRNSSIATTPGYHGNAYYLGLKFGHDLGGMPFRLAGEIGRGSGDFVGIAPGKRFGIIWGQHTTVATAPSNINPAQAGAAGPTGLSNLKVLDAGVGITPIAKLGFDLNWYRFQWDSHNAAAGSYQGGTSAGTEYDFIVSWKHSDNVSLEANAASFQVGDSIRNVGAGAVTSPITRLGADIKLKF